MCVHCGKHRNSSKCYIKYPHLPPTEHPARAHLDETNNDTKALVAEQSANTTSPSENDFFCIPSWKVYRSKCYLAVICAFCIFIWTLDYRFWLYLTCNFRSICIHFIHRSFSYFQATLVQTLLHPLLDAVTSDWIYA